MEGHACIAAGSVGSEGLLGGLAPGRQAYWASRLLNYKLQPVERLGIGVRAAGRAQASSGSQGVQALMSELRSETSTTVPPLASPAALQESSLDPQPPTQPTAHSAAA